MNFIVYSWRVPRPIEDKWEPLDSLGATGAVVAANTKRLRGAMPYTELSARLKALGRDIPTWGLRKIESGGRRVDTDDLMALAAALGVSPVTLLYPGTPDAAEQLAITGLPKPESARVVWEWMTASIWGYWAMEHAGGFTTPSEFFRRAWPQWLIDAQEVDGQSALDTYDRVWAEARDKTRQQVFDQNRGTSNGDD